MTLTKNKTASWILPMTGRLAVQTQHSNQGLLREEQETDNSEEQDRS